MYDAKNAKEVTGGVPPDTILDGEITEIKDGKVTDFVENTEEWKGDKNGPAINVKVEYEFKNTKGEILQLFTYKSEEGQTMYTKKSNMGKFVEKYKSAPTVGQKIKLLSNNEGFLKIKLQ